MGISPARSIEEESLSLSCSRGRYRHQQVACNPWHRSLLPERRTDDHRKRCLSLFFQYFFYASIVLVKDKPLINKRDQIDVLGIKIDFVGVFDDISHALRILRSIFYANNPLCVT